MRNFNVRSIAFAALLQMVICIPAAHAADAIDFKLGGDWYLDVNHTSRQSITILGNNTENNTTIHLVFKVHILKNDAAGTELEHTVVAVDDVTSSPGKPEQKGIFKGLRDQKFTVKLKPHNDTIDVDGLDGIAEAVFGAEAKNAPANQKKFLDDMLKYVLRLHIVEFYTPTPDHATDAWSHTLEMKLQSMALIKADREYKLAGPATSDGKTYESIKWVGKLSVAPLKDDDGILPFKVIDLKLIGDPVDTGTILWDRAAGRPAKVDSEQVTSLEMKMEIGGKPVDGAAKTTDAFEFKALEKYEETK